jgi:Flp pilus assembly protein TadG
MPRFRKHWRVLRQETSGAEIAELAAVLPLLIALIFGILWFGRAFNIYTTINRATREAAEAAALNSCATCGNLPNTNIFANVVNPILLAAHLDPSLAEPTFTVTPHVILNPNSGSNVLGSVVTMSYPYTFKLNGLTCCPPTLTPITLGVTINGRAQAQEEN